MEMKKCDLCGSETVVEGFEQIKMCDDCKGKLGVKDAKEWSLWLVQSLDSTELKGVCA
ncbi:MAG: hypothetical protein ACOC5D_01445 [Thermoplasmatota archaeon]